MTAHLLAIDQGTTGTTALIMATGGQTLGKANIEFQQHFPAPGLVEHEPEEIWQSVRTAVREALKSAQIDRGEIAAIGITNQRETTLLWERATGRSVGRAIVWQDRRTASRCEELREQGHAARVRSITGLVLDPYFSGTKLEWLLKQPEIGARAAAGELLFGTVDTYLIWRMNGGGSAAPHLTDATNASRTLLMNLREQRWDDEMLTLLGIPRLLLPRITPSAGRFGQTRGFDPLPDGIPISGVAGDQQAALFGQACFAAGDVKCTYGTGAFILMNTGTEVRESRSGLLSTIACSLPHETTYALEGSCFIAGAAVQWLRDGLGIIANSSEIEQLARSVEDSNGVVFVPALAGLGAPYWDAGARGTIVGLTRGTNKAHLARATLEAIALQVNDLISAMTRDLGRPVERLRVDGGASANDLMMQFQADVSQLSVERPAELETTARGAAMLAALGSGIFGSARDAAQMVTHSARFQPTMADSTRQRHLSGWKDAVERARSKAAADSVI